VLPRVQDQPDEQRCQNSNGQPGGQAWKLLSDATAAYCKKLGRVLKPMSTTEGPSVPVRQVILFLNQVGNDIPTIGRPCLRYPSIFYPRGYTTQPVFGTSDGITTGRHDTGLACNAELIQATDEGVCVNCCDQQHERHGVVQREKIRA
jgi:hypothetical protein